MTMTEIIAEHMWEKVEPIVKKVREEKEKQKRTKRGRPRSDEKKAFRGIVYILRTGSQWTELPKEYGSKSTVHRYFQLPVRSN